MQLDYSEDEFFENVLKNLNGRTIREMSMLGQVRKIIENNLSKWLFAATPKSADSLKCP